MKTDIQIDGAFIRRVYRTSAAVGVLAVLSVSSQWGWTPAIGLLLGLTLALGSLRALEWAVRALLTPGSSRHAGLRIAVVGVLKLVAIGAVLTVALGIAQRLQANLLAFVLGIAAGFVLVHLVIVLKAVGIWLLSKGVVLTPADRPRIR